MTRCSAQVGLPFAALLCSGCIAPTPLPNTDGYEFCQAIGNQMRQISSGWAIAGWLLVCFVVAGIGVGNLMGNDWGSNGDPWWKKAKGALTLVGALSLVPFAYYALSRSSSSADAAAAAETGLTALTSKEAYKICVTAKASWISSRVTSNAIGESTLRATEAAKREKATTTGPKNTEPEKSQPEPEPVKSTEALDTAAP